MSNAGPGPQACTIVARNYLAFARVLATSFLEHHPGWGFTVVLVDGNGTEDDGGEVFRLLHLADLDLPVAELHQMAMIYTVTELATAVKPVVLRHLVRESSGPVVYLDPDIQVFQPFPEVADLATSHGIVLTPHVLTSMPRDGLLPSESQILISGMFNLGFIAVAPQATDFLDWWGERLRRDALVDPCRGLFTDQRWVDFVPSLYDHHVVRDPGFNVAYWNVFQRPLVPVDGGYEVLGHRLRFFHFSGFDPAKPHLLSKHQGDKPRTLLSADPVLADLCQHYADRLMAAGYADAARHPYGLEQFPNGLVLESRIRRLCRVALESGTATDAPPDPFLPGGADRLVEWLRKPVCSGPGRDRVSRYLVALWDEHPWLQAAFPGLSTESAPRFHAWCAEHPALDHVKPRLLRSTAMPAEDGTRQLASVHAPGEPRVPGITIGGYFEAELGVGQAARLLVSGIEESGIPFSTITYDRTLSRREHPFRPRVSPHRFDINIICINADQTPYFVQDMGPQFTEGTYDIGMWFWETEIFPPVMHQAFEHVDEIWTASTFTRDAIAKATDKPVHVVPLPVTVPSRSTHLTRADVGLPAGFVFLNSFDALSVVGRKNPTAVVEAFSRAFAPGEGASLVLKTMNSSGAIGGIEQLRFAAAHHPDIHIIDGCLSPGQIRALTELSDCTVSLHRSEGFGLTLLEAMAVGRPVIATGYSGNLTFMNHHNSFLVSHQLVPIGPGHEPYPAEARWADPDVDEAARYMRLVFDDDESARARGLRAQNDMRRLHNPAVTAAFLTRRLQEIRHTRGGASLLGAAS